MKVAGRYSLRVQGSDDPWSVTIPAVPPPVRSGDDRIPQPAAARRENSKAPPVVARTEVMSTPTFGGIR